jgi:hypothetical protein
VDVRSTPWAGEPVGKQFGKQALMMQRLEGRESNKIIISEQKYAI